MKILIINGSPRKNGATTGILWKMQKEIFVQKDTKAERVHLADEGIYRPDAFGNGAGPLC